MNDDRKPLLYKRVLVTRARNQAEQLSRRIEALGGIPVEWPLIRVQAMSDPAARGFADDAIGQIDRFDWIVFTSVNGVKYFFERFNELCMAAHAIKQKRIAAVGPATAEALEPYGLDAELIPGQYDADGLTEALSGVCAPGQRLLLARGNLAGKALPTRLREYGFEVTDITVYETVAESAEAERMTESIVQMFKRRELPIVTFASSSAVQHFHRLLTASGESLPGLLTGVVMYCIGQPTSKTARELGFLNIRTAREATIESLAEALTCHTTRGGFVI